MPDKIKKRELVTDQAVLDQLESDETPEVKPIIDQVDEALGNNGLPVNKRELVMAQLRHETGKPELDSDVARVNNNVSGITWNENFPAEWKGTKRPASEGGNYVHFPTYNDWAKEHIKLLNKDKGAGAPIEAETVEDYAHRLKKNGYYRDPESVYVNGMKAMKDKYGKQPEEVTDPNLLAELEGDQSTIQKKSPDQTGLAESTPTSSTTAQENIGLTPTDSITGLPVFGKQEATQIQPGPHPQTQQPVVLASEDEENPVIAVKKKTDAATSYLTNELANRISSFPSYTDNVKSTPFADPNSVMHKIADPHGDPAFTGGLTQAIVGDIERERKEKLTQANQDLINGDPNTSQQTITDINSQYNKKIEDVKDATNHVVGLQLFNKEYTEKPLTDAAAETKIKTLNKQREADIKNANDQMEQSLKGENKLDMDKADAERIDRIKQINKEADAQINTVQSQKKWDAVRLGIEQRKLSGDKQAEIDAKTYDNGGNISPAARVQYQISGNEIKKTGMNNAFANGQDQVVEETKDKIQSPLQIERDNQQYYNTVRANKIGNAKYADENPLFRAIVPHFGAMSQEDVEKYGKQVGLTDAQIAKINPAQVPTSSTVWQQFAKGAFNTPADIYERMIGRPLMKDTGATPEEIDARFAPGWQNERGVGATIAGNMPTDQNSFKNVRGAIGQMFEGAGGLSTFVGEIGATAKALEATGVAKTAASAEKMANFGVMAFNGYNSAYNESADIIGDKPKDEWKRQAYAITSGIIEGKIFTMIHGASPAELGQRALGTEKGDRLLEEIRNAKSIEDLQTPSFKEAMAQKFMAVAAENGQQVGLATANTAAQDIIKSVIAPDKKQDIGEDLKNTAVSTSLAMMIPSILGGMSHGTMQTPLAKAAMFEVGTNSKPYIDNTAKLLSEGKITPEQAQITHDAIITMGNVVKHTPTENAEGKQLTPDQVKDYAWNLLQENTLQKQADKVTQEAEALSLTPDKAQLDPIKKKIAEVTKNREEILKNAGEIKPPTPTKQKETTEDIAYEMGKEHYNLEKNKKGELNEHDQAQNDHILNQPEHHINYNLKYYNELLESGGYAPFAKKMIKKYQKLKDRFDAAKQSEAQNVQGSVATDAQSAIQDYVTKLQKEYKELGRPEGETPEEYQKHIDHLKANPEEAIGQEIEFYQKSLERAKSKEVPNEKEIAAIESHIDELNTISDKIKEGKKNISENKKEDISLTPQTKTTDHGNGNENGEGTRQNSAEISETKGRGTSTEVRGDKENGRLQGQEESIAETPKDNEKAGDQKSPALPVSGKERRKKMKLTAEEELPIPVKEEPKLQTQDLGKVKGKPEEKTEDAVNEATINHPDAPADVMMSDHPEGESFNEAKDRFKGAVDKIAKDAPDNTVVMTHSWGLKLLDAAEKKGWDHADLGAEHQKGSTETGDLIEYKTDDGRTIWFARHGETEANKEGLQRTNDTPLTDKGREQAKDIATKLKEQGVKPSQIITSDLPRAKETSDIISKEFVNERAIAKANKNKPDAANDNTFIDKDGKKWGIEYDEDGEMEFYDWDQYHNEHAKERMKDYDQSVAQAEKNVKDIAAPIKIKKAISDKEKELKALQDKNKKLSDRVDKEGLHEKVIDEISDVGNRMEALRLELEALNKKLNTPFELKAENKKIEQPKEAPNPARSVATDESKKQPTPPTKKLRNQSKKGWSLSEHLQRKEKATKEDPASMEEYVLQTMLNMDDKHPENKWSFSSIEKEIPRGAEEKAKAKQFASNHPKATPVDVWASDIARSEGEKHGNLPFDVPDESDIRNMIIDNISRFPSKTALLEHLEDLQNARKEQAASVDREGQLRYEEEANREPTLHELAQMYAGKDGEDFEGYDDQGHPIYKSVMEGYDDIRKTELTQADEQKIKEYYNKYFDDNTQKVDYDKAHGDHSAMATLKDELSPAGKELLENIIPFDNFEQHSETVQKLITDATEYSRNQREAARVQKETRVEREGTPDGRSVTRASESKNAEETSGRERLNQAPNDERSVATDASSETETTSQNRLKEIDEELLKQHASQKVSAQKRTAAEKAKDIAEANRHNDNFYKKQDRIDKLEEEKASILAKVEKEERAASIKKVYNDYADNLEKKYEANKKSHEGLALSGILGISTKIGDHVADFLVARAIEGIRELGNIHVAIDRAIRLAKEKFGAEAKDLSREDNKAIKDHLLSLGQKHPVIEHEPILPIDHEEYAKDLLADIKSGTISYEDAVKEVNDQVIENREGKPLSDHVQENNKAKILKYIDFHIQDDLTSIKNDTTRLRRQQLGLDEEIPAAKKEFGQTWEEAKEKMENNPQTAQNLIAELSQKARPLTDVENAVLLHHQNTKEIEILKLNDNINKAAEKGDRESVLENKVSKSRVLDELQQIYDINKAVGTENARGLASRRMMVDRKYSLVNMVAEKRATANEGQPLSDEQQEEIEKLHAKIKDTQSAFDDYVKQSESQIIDLQRKALEGKLKDKKSASTKLHQFAERIRQASKNQAYSSPIPITPHMVADAIDLIADGVEKGEQLIDLVKKAVGKMSAANPGIDDRQLEKEINKSLIESGILEPSPERRKATDMSSLFTNGKLDREAVRLKVEADRAKAQFDINVKRDKQKQLSGLAKAQDLFIKWQRAFKLSNPITMGKLAMAGMTRLVTTPLEDIVGGAYSTILPQLAKGAIGEGGGLNVSETARTFKDGFMRGLKDSKEIMSKQNQGASELDVLFGKIGELPPEAIDFFGQLHSATKAPIKRAIFERSLERRLRRNLAYGVDITDPMVQTSIAMDAYKDANRAIFMQDNKVAEGWQSLVRSFEKVDPKTGKAPMKGFATAMQWMVPFVKVPTNIVAETARNVYGVPVGAAQALHAAFTKGIENLTSEEKDIIMRNLKKGSLGIAALALGYFNPQNFGGYYQPGQKRKDEDAEALGLKFGGTKIPAWFVESPIFQVMQIGATVRRVKDQKVKGEEKGIGEGLWAGASGLVQNVPMASQPIRIGKIFSSPGDRNYYFGELAKSTIDPAILTYLAKVTDPADEGNPIRKMLAPENKRKSPKTIMEHIKSGLPFFREQLDEKRPKHSNEDVSKSLY